MFTCFITKAEKVVKYCSRLHHFNCTLVFQSQQLISYSTKEKVKEIRKKDTKTYNHKSDKAVTRRCRRR